MGLEPDPADLEPLTAEQSRTLDLLRARFPDAAVEARSFRGQLSIWIDPGAVIQALRVLKGDPAHLYEMITDLTAVDHLTYLKPGEPRFEVIYTLTSLTFRRRIQLRIRVREDEPVDSATGVWSGANFMEREVYDLMGIVFRGHPNLERILTADGWIGHPLRKDFPTQSDQFPNVES